MGSMLAWSTGDDELESAPPPGGRASSRLSGASAPSNYPKEQLDACNKAHGLTVQPVAPVVPRPLRPSSLAEPIQLAEEASQLAAAEARADNLEGALHTMVTMAQGRQGCSTVDQRLSQQSSLTSEPAHAPLPKMAQPHAARDKEGDTLAFQRNPVASGSKSELSFTSSSKPSTASQGKLRESIGSSVGDALAFRPAPLTHRQLTFGPAAFQQTARQDNDASPVPPAVPQAQELEHGDSMQWSAGSSAMHAPFKNAIDSPVGWIWGRGRCSRSFCPLGLPTQETSLLSSRLDM